MKTIKIIGKVLKVDGLTVEIMTKKEVIRASMDKPKKLKKNQKMEFTLEKPIGAGLGDIIAVKKVNRRRKYSRN